MKLPPHARAVVTGAGSGLGRAVSLELAARGARVLCTDIHADGVEETVRWIRGRGQEAQSMIADVREPGEVAAMAARADELWGGTDVLVNNAGVAVVGEVGKIPLQDWKWQIDVNLWGVIYGCHHFVPRMKAQKQGWILNVASMAGIVSAPLMAPYNVTKAGVIALSETLATELAPDGVTVTVLCPSFFRTNIHKTSRSHGMEGFRSRAEKLVTEAKWSAEDVARCAIDGLERGALYVMPQADAKLFWRAKRALGATFFGALGAMARHGMLDRVLGHRPAGGARH
jgi:NAD(P)-dependent dehydrogenase (short-subunit alcohol dehydrogenase family)